MPTPTIASRYVLQILENFQEMVSVEELQSKVWPGSETEIVPAHLLLTSAHNGGLVIGSYDLGTGQDPAQEVDFSWSPEAVHPDHAKLVGFVFGFPGLYSTPEGNKAKHCSHMLGVHPEHRDQGIGFALKRAQWQMVRNQGLDRITWTYDPLLSRNAHLNITRLGTVCNTYIIEAYGQMRDGLNLGLPSDRFQVDWWINSQRVSHRLSKKARRKLDLAHFLAAGANILNPSSIREDGLPIPVVDSSNVMSDDVINNPILLVEIPADFMKLKGLDQALALEWRLHTRELFNGLFSKGYMVTDFIYLPGKYARSFYGLTHGDSTL